MSEELLAQGKEAYKNKDYKTAAAFYEKAMAEGNARAMNFLAGMYMSGLGVKKNVEKSYELFKKAAEAGDELALSTANMLGLIHLPSPAEQWRNRVEEVHKLRKEEKYQEAMHKYADLARDKEIPYEHKAECMYWIGMMYKLGQGIPKNDKKAKEWLRKAADNNNRDAVYALELDTSPISCKNDCFKATICITKNVDFIRSAEVLAQLAKTFKSEIKIHIKGKTADAKSILIVASIGLVYATVVDITAKGEDAEEAVTRIANLISSNFNLEDEYIAELISNGKIKMISELCKEKGGEESPKIAHINGYAKAMTYVNNINVICVRPASIIVQLARSFKSEIRFRVRDKAYLVDAKSVIMIVSSGLVKGTKVEIYAEGKDAGEAVNSLANLMNSGFKGE